MRSKGFKCGIEGSSVVASGRIISGRLTTNIKYALFVSMSLRWHFLILECITPLCTSCDISGREIRVSQKYTLVQCKTQCLNDNNCLGIDFGKGDRGGECFFNYEQNDDFRSHKNFDGWKKFSNCSVHNII